MKELINKALASLLSAGGKVLANHFDKLLVAAMFIYMVHVAVSLMYGHVAQENVAWIQELASGFQGALLGLITGVAIGQRLAAAKVNDDEKKGV